MSDSLPRIFFGRIFPIYSLILARRSGSHEGGTSGDVRGCEEGGGRGGGGWRRVAGGGSVRGRAAASEEDPGHDGGPGGDSGTPVSSFLVISDPVFTALVLFCSTW